MLSIALVLCAALGCAKEEDGTVPAWVGTWVSRCDSNTMTSKQVIWVINADGTFVQSENAYSTADCTGTLVSSTTQQTGTYVVGNDTPAMAGVKNLDLNITLTSSGQQYNYYTIFKLDGDVLTRGASSMMYDGNSQNTRHSVLSTDEDDIFDRQ